MLVLWIPGDFPRGGVRGVVGVVIGPMGDGLRGQVVVRVLPRGQHYPNLRSKPALELILWTNKQRNYTQTHTHIQKRPFPFQMAITKTTCDLNEKKKKLQAN